MRITLNPSIFIVYGLITCISAHAEKNVSKFHPALTTVQYSSVKKGASVVIVNFQLHFDIDDTCTSFNTHQTCGECWMKL